MLLLSFAECHDPRFPYSSHRPPHALNLSSPEWGSAFTIPGRIYWEETPTSSFFFFLPQRRQSHNDTAPFRDASLPKKYSPPSSPPHIKHLPEKGPFFSSCRSELFPTNICWFVLVGQSRFSSCTRQVLFNTTSDASKIMGWLNIFHLKIKIDQFRTTSK